LNAVGAFVLFDTRSEEGKINGKKLEGREKKRE